MPTFVIHSLGQHSRKVSIDAPPIRVGRDPECDIVVTDSSASREHAVFMSDSAGRWHVGCVSETNPIVVDGALVTESVGVGDGTEVLVGSACLIVFAATDITANQHMGAAGSFNQSECVDCRWTGLVGAFRRVPACPRCGGTRLHALNTYRPDDAPAAVFQGSTRVIPMDEAQALFRKLHDAKRSRLERADGRTDGPVRIDLSEDRPVRVSKEPSSDLKLHGFVFGGGLKVTWSGSFFVVDSAMVFPAMRVNGESARKARLRSGDTIQVGPNRFVFRTD